MQSNQVIYCCPFIDCSKAVLNVSLFGTPLRPMMNAKLSQETLIMVVYGNSFKGVFWAVVSQPLLTEFGIHPILESCAGVLLQFLSD